MIGYRYILQHGILWKDNQKCLLPTSPPTRLNGLLEAEAKNFLMNQKCFLIRWEENFDQIKHSNWWHVIKDSDTKIESLSANTRSKVRRGLKFFDCVKLSTEELISEGYIVYKRAFSGYKTHEKIYTQKEFNSAIEKMPNYTEFWGIRKKDSGELVGFSENYIEDKVCFFNSIWFDPNSLRKYSSYAFFFTVSNHYISDRSFKYVSNGAKSISHDTAIHEFLLSKFGYRKAYSNVKIIYNPFLRVMIALLMPLEVFFRKLNSFYPNRIAIILNQERLIRENRKFTEVQ